MNDNEPQTQTTSFKVSMSSVIESDRVLFARESSKFFKIILILISTDFFLTEFVFIYDYIIDEQNLAFFGIFSSIALIFFGVILILLYCKKSILSKITRFVYLIAGLLYFIFQIILKMINLSNKDFSLSIYDIILFIILSLSIIPRISGFLYIRIFEKSLIKMEEAKLTEEHQMFVEKVLNKLDRSTVGDRILEKEIEKELEKDEEEIIFKMNNEKLITEKIENNTNNNNGNDNNDGKNNNN